MSDAPGEIGLVGDGMGRWTLFSWEDGDDPNAAIRYIREDLVAKSQELASKWVTYLERQFEQTDDGAAYHDWQEAKSKLEDAGDDYRLSAATRAEWAERAMKAEAERDRAWNDALEAVEKRLRAKARKNGEAFAWIYDDEADAVRAMKRVPTSAENVQLSSASD